MFTDSKALAQFAEQMMVEFLQEHQPLVERVGLHITRDVMRDEVKSFAMVSPTLKNPESTAWNKGISDLKDKIRIRLERPLGVAKLH